MLAIPVTFVYATTTGEEEEGGGEDTTISETAANIAEGLTATGVEGGGEDTTTDEAAASSATTLSPTGLPQTNSDNQLQATLNGDNFSTGDEIVITGTVEERGFDSAVNIQVIDPNGQTVHSAYPLVSADNTFEYSFTAGVQPSFSVSPPMEESGNYRMTLQYLNPENNFGEDTFRSEIEFVFTYTHNPEAATEEETAAATSTTDTTTARNTVNVTAIRTVAGEGLQDVLALNATITESNSTQTMEILTDILQLGRYFQNIRGNLTGVQTQAQAIE